MSIIEEKLKIEKQFTKNKDKLISLLEFNLNTDIINQLISLCESYNDLSITELQQSEQSISKTYIIINQNTELPIQYKKQLLLIINNLKKIVDKLIVNNIINTI